MHPPGFFAGAAPGFPHGPPPAGFPAPGAFGPMPPPFGPGPPGFHRPPPGFPPGTGPLPGPPPHGRPRAPTPAAGGGAGVSKSAAAAAKAAPAASPVEPKAPRQAEPLVEEVPAKATASPTAEELAATPKAVAVEKMPDTDDEVVKAGCETEGEAGASGAAKCAELKAGLRALRKRLRSRGTALGAAVAKGTTSAAGAALAAGAVAKGAGVKHGPPVMHPPHMLPPPGMPPPFGPHMPPMMYPPPGPPPPGPPPLGPPPLPASKRSRRGKGRNSAREAPAPSPKAAGALPAKGATAIGAVAKGAAAAGAVAKGSPAATGSPVAAGSPVAGAAAKDSGKGVLRLVPPRMVDGRPYPGSVSMAERRKLLDDDEEMMGPAPCRFLVVVWPDRRLAFHMVRTRQIALTHFKEDFTGRVNMQTGYRLMMLVPQDERRGAADVYGYVIFRLEDSVVCVVQIAVADEHRGKGFGRQAVNWLIQYTENARCDSVVLGSPLESVEFYEECGFERATASTQVLQGKDLAPGCLPMEYRRGSKKGMGPKRRQLSREELITRVFDILDGDGDGALSKAELRRYAGWSGFGGTEVQWAEEWSRICSHSGASPDAGVDRALFSKLVNDRSEAGLFIDNDGLRDMLTQLQVQTPAHLRRKKMVFPSPGSIELSRKELVQAIFRLCDVDRDGLLCEQEMMTFAQQTGLGDTDAVQWKDEYALLCSDNGADPAKGISVQLLEKMLNDQGESGCYCDDGELRAIKAGLELEAKEQNMKATMLSPERAALVRELFRVFDTDHDGCLSEQEMRCLADQIGFKGDAVRWTEEYRQICSGRGNGAAPGAPDLARVESLVNDTGEGGWYCTEEELKRIVQTGPRPPVDSAPPRVVAPRLGLQPAGVKATGSTVGTSPARAELVKSVFSTLSSGAGSLGEAEMRRFAVFTGFEGSDEDWAEEFKLICAEGGGTTGLDLAHFGRLVDDAGDTGCHCGDGELQEILAELQKKAGIAPG